MLKAHAATSRQLPISNSLEVIQVCNICFKRMKNDIIMNGPDNTVEDIRRYNGEFNTIRKCPAMEALERLTPGGSEFLDDPAFCFTYVQKKQRDLQDIAVNAHRKLNECNELREDAERKLITLSRPNGGTNGKGNGK